MGSCMGKCKRNLKKDIITEKTVKTAHSEKIEKSEQHIVDNWKAEGSASSNATP